MIEVKWCTLVTVSNGKHTIVELHLCDGWSLVEVMVALEQTNTVIGNR